jgi:hypothetical protein
MLMIAPSGGLQPGDGFAPRFLARFMQQLRAVLLELLRRTNLRPTLHFLTRRF